jgi:hypothetical protein
LLGKARIAMIAATLIVVTGGQVQRESADVDDLSAVGSPLKCAGKTSLSEQLDVVAREAKFRYFLDGTATNVSSKPVLALELQFDISTRLRYGEHVEYRVDFFFTREALAPGSSLPLKIGPAGLITTRSHPWFIERNASAKARVVFVELGDGSTFGKSSWGDELHAARSSAIEYLGSLLEIKDAKGGDALSAAIRTALHDSGAPGYRRVLLGELGQTLDEHGPEGVASEIRSRLENAKQNANVM